MLDRTIVDMVQKRLKELLDESVCPEPFRIAYIDNKPVQWEWNREANTERLRLNDIRC